MMLFIGAELVFGSAGVSPAGLRGVKAHKITGVTPAYQNHSRGLHSNALHPQNSFLSEMQVTVLLIWL